MFMPQIIFTFFIMLVLTLVSPQGKACRKDEDINSNTINIVEFKANGLPFTGILGNSFLMHDDATRTKIGLSCVSTPFSLSKGSEEVSFDFEVKERTKKIYDYYRFFLAVSFEKEHHDKVLKLVGRFGGKECKSYGVPVSFYIRIMKYGENVPVLEKIESKTCYDGTGYDYMYRQYVIYKGISRVLLLPGKYTVHIKNVFPVHEYNLYKLYIESCG